jgi:AcrR family transcriptional regulator
MLSLQKLAINANTYNKNPFGSKLGEQIVVHGISMLSKLGLENFTFRKLAEEIKSTEASVYRYFSNKHVFLIFLANLYWKLLEEQIRQLSYEKLSHRNRLKKAISILVEPIKKELLSEFPYEALAEIIHAEGPKVYLTKMVDEENKDGVFLAYKTLCAEIAQMILNINSNYPFSHSLATTVIESVNDQLFFSKHLPRLTDIDSSTAKLKDFIFQMVIASILYNENN